MGDGPIFLKTSAPHPLMTTYRMSLLSAIYPSRWSVPLNDSIFSAARSRLLMFFWKFNCK
jgi:hypothetical protein